MSGLWTAYKGSGSADPTHDVLTTISRYNYQEAGSTNISPRGYESLGDMPRAIWNALLTTRLQSLKSMRKYDSEPAQ
jgi:hypothetical protein